MKIKPIGNRLLLKKRKKEEKEVLGILIVEDDSEETLSAEIIAISEELDNKELFNIGDKVIYEEFSGVSIPSDEDEILLIDVKNVLGIVED